MREQTVPAALPGANGAARALSKVWNRATVSRVASSAAAPRRARKLWLLTTGRLEIDVDGVLTVQRAVAYHARRPATSGEVRGPRDVLGD